MWPNEINFLTATDSKQQGKITTKASTAEGAEQEQGKTLTTEATE